MAQAPKLVVLTWEGGLRFTGGVPGAHAITVDGHATVAPSPVDALLIALGGCTGSDVVGILEKMRIELAECRVELSGIRRETDPRRFVSIHLHYHLRGTGLDETRARRAIDLSLEKYCSVSQSLAPDIDITYDVALG